MARTGVPMPDTSGKTDRERIKELEYKVSQLEQELRNLKSDFDDLKREVDRAKYK
jgi:predicted RNase H-like nuclease (RuvC/YqgF family)